MSKPTITESHPNVMSVPLRKCGTLRLVASEEGNEIGYATASGIAVSGTRVLMIDRTGHLRIDDGTPLGAPITLNPNTPDPIAPSTDVIDSPANTRWELTLVLPHEGKSTRYLAVPDIAGTYRVDQILSTEPTDLPAPVSASSVTFDPTGTPITFTDVQRAIEQAAVFNGGGGSGGMTWPQDVAAAVWIIPHVLGQNPSVTTTDSAHNEIKGDVSYPDINTVRVVFGRAITGYAELR